MYMGLSCLFFLWILKDAEVQFFLSKIQVQKRFAKFHRRLCGTIFYVPLKQIAETRNVNSNRRHLTVIDTEKVFGLCTCGSNERMVQSFPHVLKTTPNHSKAHSSRPMRNKYTTSVHWLLNLLYTMYTKPWTLLCNHTEDNTRYTSKHVWKTNIN